MRSVFVQKHRKHAFSCVRTRDGIPRSWQKSTIRSPNKHPPRGGLTGCTIEDSPQTTTTSTLLPFRRHRARSLLHLRLSFRGCLIVSIDPSSISNLKLHIAALAPGLWDFMRAKAVYCARWISYDLLFFSSPDCNGWSRNGWSTHAGWRSNNIDTRLLRSSFKKKRVNDNDISWNTYLKAV